ncbi:MAG: TIGR00730 family Rossman fold protein [Gammaproteobacteria bacterium]
MSNDANKPASLCVFCSSSANAVRGAWREHALVLGRALAARGIRLIYGGAHVGLMGVLADAVLRNGGEVIGVIPRALLRKEVAHPELSRLEIVESMHERKARMAELAGGFIALPGGMGTLDELFEILTWRQLGMHAKACGLLDSAGYYRPLLAFLAEGERQGLIRPAVEELLLVDDEPERLLERLIQSRPRPRRPVIGPAET